MSWISYGVSIDYISHRKRFYLGHYYFLEFDILLECKDVLDKKKEIELVYSSPVPTQLSLRDFSSMRGSGGSGGNCFFVLLKFTFFFPTSLLPNSHDFFFRSEFSRFTLDVFWCINTLHLSTCRSHSFFLPSYIPFHSMQCLRSITSSFHQFYLSLPSSSIIIHQNDHCIMARLSSSRSQSSSPN